MFKNISLCIFAATAMMACNNSKYEGYRVSDSGLHYK
ncbi:MAG: hypothetical protein RLZZ46_1400, partial [Bacteroidota bacterium]